MEPQQHCDAGEDSKPTTSGDDNVVRNEASSDPLTSAKNNPHEVLKIPETTPFLYRQDVVRSNSGGKIGIVTEVAGDSDSDSSDSDDEDEDEEEEEDNDPDADADADEEESGVDEDGDTNGNTDSNSNPLPADQVRVLWLDESETTQNINDVTVIDRGFLHGDYVAAASDPTGQVGVVVDVNISVDLLTTNGSVISNVSSRDLKRVRDFTVGDYVVLGPWLGRIDDVLDNVTVLFDDGSVCKVMKADPLRLKPVGKNMLEDGHFPYYPGQRVKGSSSSVFKNSRWLSGLWKANRLEGTVTKVTVGSVFVYWIASAGYGPDSSTTPAEEQSPKNLKLLSCFAHANWQLGDWCLLPSPPTKSSSVTLDKSLSKLELHDSPKAVVRCGQTKSESDSEVVTPEEMQGSSDSMDVDVSSAIEGNVGNKEGNFNESSSCSSSLSASKEHVHETWPIHRKKLRKVVVRRDKKTRKKEENFERALLIFNTKTRVDVAWQDGKVERGLDSITLIPIDNPGDHEFVAEQYVVEKAADDGEDTNEVKRVGVVKSVNAKERTACVKWLKIVARPEDPKEFDKEEVVSVYELEGHPDYDYCYGDVVVRLSPVAVPTPTASHENCDEESAKLTDPNEVEGDTTHHTGGASLDEANAFADLSWVGNITGLVNGDIEVTWADGMISTVGPQAIYVVGRDDEDESVAGDGDISDDAASWETLPDDEAETLENTGLGLRNDSDFSHDAEESTTNAENSGRNGPLSIPLAALGYMTRLASGIFSRGRKHTESSNSTSGSENEHVSKIDPGDESSSQKSSGIDESDGKGDADAVAKDSDLLEAAVAHFKLNPQESHAPSKSEVDSSGFRGFDIAKNPYDHYYLGLSGHNNAGRKWLKKVQQDWNILQNNLPDAIYVRVYEDRMDLLRAVIVGAYGTPYQNGLFFFDFHLPPEYPDVPPSANYHSGGWRINPNLYEEGKVCLSLLNTWTGRGNEVWDPSSSSILQVLVSLQGLVLNSKPYFNEAGYDKQVGTAEGEKNSLSYNENTFLLNCKTMMYLMRRPPKDFETLVKEHFKKRGYYILKACDAYLKGYLIGSLTEDASIGDKSIANANSVGFKIMLAKIVPKLFLALSEAGADCDEFKHLREIDESVYLKKSDSDDLKESDCDELKDLEQQS